LSIESLPRGGEQNHFNLLRLIAASAVVISHAYGVTLGPTTPDPFERLLGIDLGATAVTAFFAISGYFVSLSFDRRKSNFGFVLARVTRIIPGLLVVSLITAFIVGPLLTVLPLPAYFSHKAVWLYSLQNASIYRIMTSTLPGVFVHNPIPDDINASLWTLFYEVGCYIGLFAVGVLGFLRRDRFFWVLAAWLPVYFVARYGPWDKLVQFAIFSVPFLFGMAAYHFRSAKILKGWIALVLFVLAFALMVTGHGIEELWSLAVAYGVLWLGFAPAPALLAYNRIGDFSYGTYIYGFPAEQVIAAVLPGIGPVMMIVLGLPASILLGAFSWRFVDRPALVLRHMTGRRSGPAAEPSYPGAAEGTAAPLAPARQPD
jgi:peptidoglycan/LPS O-acetylase OafA/YrhL